MNNQQKFHLAPPSKRINLCRQVLANFPLLPRGESATCHPPALATYRLSQPHAICLPQRHATHLSLPAYAACYMLAPAACNLPASAGCHLPTSATYHLPVSVTCTCLLPAPAACLPISALCHLPVSAVRYLPAVHKLLIFTHILFPARTCQ